MKTLKKIYYFITYLLLVSFTVFILTLNIHFYRIPLNKFIEDFLSFYQNIFVIYTIFLSFFIAFFSIDKEHPILFSIKIKELFKSLGFLFLGYVFLFLYKVTELGSRFTEETFINCSNPLKLFNFNEYLCLFLFAGIIIEIFSTTKDTLKSIYTYLENCQKNVYNEAILQLEKEKQRNFKLIEKINNLRIPYDEKIKYILEAQERIEEFDEMIADYQRLKQKKPSE